MIVSKTYKTINYFRATSLLFVLCTSLTVCAENGVGKFFRRLGTAIDTLTVKGVDRRYIQAPEKPWQIMVKGNANEVKMNMETVFEDGDFNYKWGSKISTGVGKSLGGWIGYRGYGLGYQVTMGEQKGSNFNIGLGGSKYTLRLSIRKFKTEETDIHFRGNLPDIEDSKFDDRLKMEMDEPIRVSSILLDGYYMFNGKHFSNTAGYDQSTIQMRSAGSFIVGASWLNASIDYSANMNTFFVIMMNNCGRIRINQVNIGAGYAYNWVPCKGLLVNAMFMPTITPYSQLKVWNYDFDETDNYEYKSSDVNYSYSRIKVNLCSWVTLVYNYKDWFATAKGQWNQFSYKRNDSNGRLSDWYLNVGIGWRF